MTFGDAQRTYRERVTGDVSLKQRSNSNHGIAGLMPRFMG
jgi:hypothetical protein